MGAGSINIEVRPFSRFAFSAGVGGSFINGGDAGAILRGARVQSHFLLGNSAHLFEIAVGGGPISGFASRPDGSDDIQHLFIPAAQLGYRYQKSDGGVMARFGLGTSFFTVGLMVSGGWTF
ncbi:MAG: hypothetical protein AAFV53_16180 [Myxococcota bacterium]